MTNIKDNILKIVESNKVHMTPKWKFVLYSILSILGVIFSLLSVAFLASLLVFVLATSGFVYMPLFGLKETLHFLVSVPALLFILAVAMIFVTETLVRKYAFAFKKPILITLLSITFLSVVVGFFLAQTPMHFKMRNYMKDHHMEMMRGVYDRPLPFAPVSGMTVLKGIVIATTSDSLTVKLFDDRVIVAKATGTYPLPLFVKEGEGIALFGVPRDDISFEAFQIKPLGQGKNRGGRDGFGFRRMMSEIK